MPAPPEARDIREPLPEPEPEWADPEWDTAPEEPEEAKEPEQSPEAPDDDLLNLIAGD